MLACRSQASLLTPGFTTGCFVIPKTGDCRYWNTFRGRLNGKQVATAQQDIFDRVSC